MVEWETSQTGSVQYHRVARQVQIEFDEDDKPNGNGMANWGSAWYATDDAIDLTKKASADTEARGLFASAGKLDNGVDRNFRAINDRWPVFAFSRDLGNVNDRTQSVRFTVGLTLPNAVQFLGANGLMKLPSLWVSYFGNASSAVSTNASDAFAQETKPLPVGILPSRLQYHVCDLNLVGQQSPA
jgi:hypothetical protein